jgi:CRP-like cAMP-binding protein
MSADIQIDVTSLLRKNAVFGVLSPERLKTLAATGFPVRLEKGMRLFSAGDTSHCVYAVLNGELEVTSASPDGQEVWLARLTPGALIGEMGVLDGAPRSADATAQRRTTLWQINRLAILEALKAEPNAALALLSLLAQRLRAADALMHRTATLDLGGRLARLLLDESTSGRITFSQGEMARLIGASRERVNRKLAEWRHKDWIDTGTAGLTVRNRNALRALCENGAAL